MTEDMVQQPEIGCHASVQCIADLQYPVKRVLPERFGVLVVMVPCADAPFWNDRDAEVADQQPEILNSEIQSEIEKGQRQYQDNR